MTVYAAQLLKSLTRNLKRDNDLADAKAAFSTASEHLCKWRRRADDPAWLNGPADSSNWKYRIAKARIHEWHWKQAVAANECIRLQGEAQ